MTRKKSSGARSEVVGVRLSRSELAVLDDLVEIGLFSSRSDIVYWLVTEGLHTIPVEKLSSRARKIRQIKEDALKDTRKEMDKLRQAHTEAWGEGGREPVPGKRQIGAGMISSDPPLGIDYDRRLIVTNRGQTKIPLDKKHYTDPEKEMLRRLVTWIEESKDRHEEFRRREDDLFGGLLKEATEALER